MNRDVAYQKTTDFFIKCKGLHSYFERNGGKLTTAVVNAGRSMMEKEESGREYTYSELGRLMRMLEAIDYRFEYPQPLIFKEYEHNGEKYKKRYPHKLIARGTTYNMELLRKDIAGDLYNNIVKYNIENKQLRYFHYVKTSNMDKFKANELIIDKYDSKMATVIRDNWTLEEYIEDTVQ